MNFLRKRHIHTSATDQYATSEDFSKLFTTDMASLYLLSFVLTANHEKAEQCFVAGVEDSAKGTGVFKEWASSWARRMIINNAIRMVAPSPNHASGIFAEIHSETDDGQSWPQDQHPAIASVLALADFDRFVFVMSVLERYTDNECSVLLGSSQQDIREARVRVLQQIAEYTNHDTASDQRGDHHAYHIP
jgi:hypothetical protein